MQMRGYKKYINEYTLSHPISSKRIDYLRNNANFTASNHAINRFLQPKMDMVLAKLEGFLDDPKEVVAKYRNDISDAGLYASTVAYYRDANLNMALKNIDRLIKRKKDGYFYELKGQILFESGQVAKSVIEFNKAINLLQGKQQLYSLILLAQALIDNAKNDQQLLEFAVEKLQIAQSMAPSNANISRLLNIAYGRSGNQFLANYHYANYKYLAGDLKKALQFAKKAEDQAKQSKKISDSNKIKLEDLIQIIENDNRLQSKN